MSEHKPEGFGSQAHDATKSVAVDDNSVVDAEVVNIHPEGPKFRDVVLMVSKEHLEKLLSARAESNDEAPPKPTTGDEFSSILREVDGLGWQWSTDDPPALIAKPSMTPDTDALNTLSKKYPSFPRELSHIIKHALWGWSPDIDIVGPPADLPAKVASVSSMILTDEYRSQFFFEHATRLRKFYDLDWEIMVKAAERNINRVPGTVYANISLETSETQPDFEERTAATLFAADARALKRMITLLQDALKALEKAQTMAHVMRHEEGRQHVE